jgi:hypothetical protein
LRRSEDFGRFCGHHVVSQVMHGSIPYAGRFDLSGSLPNRAAWRYAQRFPPEFGADTSEASSGIASDPRRRREKGRKRGEVETCRATIRYRRARRRLELNAPPCPPS